MTMEQEQKQPTMNDIKEQLDRIETQLNIYDRQYSKDKLNMKKSFRLSYYQAVGIAGLPLFVIKLALLLTYIQHNTLSQFDTEDTYTIVISGILILLAFFNIDKLRNKRLGSDVNSVHQTSYHDAHNPA